MVDTCDVLVIGGGIAGISAAANLAGDARVIVLERETQIGTHSTGRSAAIFILNYGNVTLRALNAMSYPGFTGQAVGESVLSPRGEMMVARPEDVPALDAYMDGAQGVDRLTAAEAKALVPVLREDQIAAALYEANSQEIDVDRLLQGYARRARAAGAQILTGQAPLTMTQGDGVWRVTTADHVIEAASVLNAAGAWADEVAAMAGAQTIGLQPMRRSAVLMPVPSQRGEIRKWPVFGSIAETWYAKPSGNDVLMISPADEDPVPPQDAWADDMVLAEGLDRFHQMVDLPLLRPTHSWAGLRSFVPDRTPVVGPDAIAPGFHWLAAQGGYGIQTAPATAAIAAASCLGQTPDAPQDVLSALAPARLLA